MFICDIVYCTDNLYNYKSTILLTLFIVTMPNNTIVDFCQQWYIPPNMLQNLIGQYSRLGGIVVNSRTVPSITYLINRLFHWGPNIVDIASAFNVEKSVLYQRARKLKLDPVHHQQFLDYVRSVDYRPLNKSVTRRVQQIARYNNYPVNDIHRLIEIRSDLDGVHMDLTPSVADGVALMRLHPWNGAHIAHLVGRGLPTIQKSYRRVFDKII